MGEGAQELAVADVNHDGLADLIAASPSEPASTGLEPEQLLVRLGAGARQFGELNRSPGPDSPSDLLLGDINADSNVDAIGIVSYGYVRTFLGGEGGSFLPGPLAGPCDTRSPSGAAADFDADGMDDVAILCRGSGAEYMTTLFTRGGASFEFGNAYTADGVLVPHAVASGDLNGDAATDLVIAGTHGTLAGVIPHLNDGSGVFSRSTAVSAPASAIELADMDGDGALDAITAAESDDAAEATLAILNGNGDGTFAAARPVLSGVPIQDLAVADLDADGKPDIAALGSGELHLFLASADGAYLRHTQPAGINPVDLAVADFDHDGFGDVAVLNRAAPSTVTIHWDAALPP